MTTRPFSQSPAYDPDVLEDTFRLAGMDGWRRLWLLWFTFLGFAFGFWWDRVRGGERLAIRQRQRAVWLRERMIHLGPTFIKVGQVLSTRPDLVPLPYVDEMASLQDQVPPFDSEVAHALIAAELGRPASEVFSVINPFPIAAASIGQVYKAKLHDGTDVVVKVQRPGLIPVVTLDMAILRKLTRFIDRHPRLSRGMPYTAILDEFGVTMFDQADYTKEGAYAERFRENFKNFPGIGTPRIHWAYTTSRIMTMDFVHGIKVTDLVALEDAGLSFHEIVRIGVRATIKQILEDGFFHADVHPGNLFVDYEGTLVFIDFGMVGELTPYVQEKIVDVFLHSVHRDFEALVQDFIDLEFLSPKVDRLALQPVAAHIFDSQYGTKDKRLTVREVFQSISTVLYEYPFRIPEKIAFILRTIITLEGIIHKLWLDFRFLEVAAPYAAKIMLTDAKSNIREKLVNELFVEGEFRPDRLSRLFGTATKEPTFRFGEVAPAVLRYLTSVEGKRVREGFLTLSFAATAEGEEAGGSWHVYLDQAAQDPSWSLDDLLAPVLSFLETADGVAFLEQLLSRRELMLGSGGGAFGAIGSALKGRSMAPETTDHLVATLRHLLAQSELTLQPLVEKAAVFLLSPGGETWFYELGASLGSREAAGEAFGRGGFVGLLAIAARHPHLDIAPLVRAFFTLAMRPPGKAWQELLLHWFNQPSRDGEVGVLGALQPLLADGRLRISELALPAMGYMLTKEGQPLRDEVLSNLRGRLGQVDLGGVAQGLWRAAGNAFGHLRAAALGDGKKAESKGSLPSPERGEGPRQGGSGGGPPESLAPPPPPP